MMEKKSFSLLFADFDSLKSITDDLKVKIGGLYFVKYDREWYLCRFDGDKYVSIIKSDYISSAYIRMREARKRGYLKRKDFPINYDLDYYQSFSSYDDLEDISTYVYSDVACGMDVDSIDEEYLKNLLYRRNLRDKDYLLKYGYVKRFTHRSYQTFQ